MKSCLFLIAGAVKWRTGEYTIDKILQVCRKLPWTMGAFLIAAFSMVGLPPTAGFFSKWYLVLGSFQSGKWPFIIVIILSSLLNAVYFFRIIENAYLRKDPEEEEPVTAKGLELPATMLVPILILGAGVLLIGVFNEQIITQVLQYAVPGGGIR
jgi:multicomponent Na+:H+ antiporter subunit D